MTTADLSDLEKKLGYKFGNSDLLITAITHASIEKIRNYERLEFLGDRVLGLMVAEHLFIRFPHEPEGDLAKRLAALVQGSFLARIAGDMELAPYIRFSESEKVAGGRENENILADVVEAIIGALYIDGGLEPCRVFIEKYWDTYFDKMTAPPQHPKTRLQEWVQAKGLPLPEYTIVNQHGPDHAPMFDVQLSIAGHDPVQASGKSRQEAEKQAAKAFLATLK